MKGLLFGYKLGQSGFYEKTVHFGNKGTARETLIRDKNGRLVKVMRQEKNQSRSEALQHRPWTEKRRKASIASQ